jgi:hypothetical protein
MSDRRRPRDIARDDQYDAAARELGHNIKTLYPHAAHRKISKHLEDRVITALDTALAEPTRCCPHIDPTRPAPYVLDLWRGLLSCGYCRHLEQTRALEGDEEYRCDQCHQLTTDDDMRTAVLKVDMITAAAMVCPSCFEKLSTTGEPQTSSSSEDEV